MAQNTMEYPASTTRLPDMPARRELKTAWAPTDRPTPGSDRKAPDTWQDQAGARGMTAEVLTALKDAALAAALAADRARRVARVLEETLAGLNGAVNAPAVAAPPVEDSAHRAGALSQREREVLALVAQGCTNKAIAETLFVSPNTVKTHVAALLQQLQADNRTQLAAIAARQQGPRGDVPGGGRVRSVSPRRDARRDTEAGQ